MSDSDERQQLDRKAAEEIWGWPSDTLLTEWTERDGMIWGTYLADCDDGVETYGPKPRPTCDPTTALRLVGESWSINFFPYPGGLTVALRRLSQPELLLYTGHVTERQEPDLQRRRALAIVRAWAAPPRGREKSSE